MELSLRRLFALTNILVWRARVRFAGGEWHWQFELPPESRDNPLLAYTRFHEDGYLWDDALCPQLAEHTDRARAAMLGGRDSYEQILRLQTANGLRWMHEWVSIDRDAEGAWRLSGLVRDVTEERVQADRMSAVLDRANCILWNAVVVDDGTERMEWTFTLHPSALQRRIFGDVAPGERRLFRGFTREHLPEANRRAQDALRSGAPGYEQEFRIERIADHAAFWLQETVTITAVEEGRWLLSGVMTDITSRKLAAEEARRRETMLGEMVAEIDGLLWRTEFADIAEIDSHWHFFVAPSPLYRRIFGREAPSGPTCLWDRSIVPKLPATTAVAMEAIRSGRSHYDNEVEVRCADGSSVRLHEHVSILRSGSALTLIGLAADITQHHQMQLRLQQAAAMDMLGTLAGGIAHDFNNILTSLRGNLDLARLEASGGEALDTAFGECEAAITRAAELSRQLLTFAKGGAPVLAAVSLPEVVAEVGSFVLRGSRVTLRQTIARDLRPVKADRGQLARILQNLILNAAQAMREGGEVHVAARNEEEASHGVSAEGPRIVLTVSDTGPGVPAEHLAKLFTPYFTTRADGHGLGLFVVYSIVRRHGGTIDVRSAPGAGTVFTLRLPASDEPPAERPGAPAAPKRLAGRVLLMDDELPIRTVLTRFLRRLGLEVEAVADGAAAVASYRRARDAGAPFDVLIMDLTVPGGLGGQDAIALIRAFDPGVCAIVASGYSENPVMARFADFGFVDAVQKPFELDHLAGLLTRHLRHSMPL
jgi:signal transduction histidine kinase/ActR/RegA family two-component response regulator